MRINTRATSHKQAEADRAADHRQPPRQPPLGEHPINPVGDDEQDEGDRITQPEEPLVPHNDQPLKENPSDTESSAPQNPHHELQNSSPVNDQQVLAANPDFHCLQNAMLAIMRRVDNIDKRHSLHHRRFEKRIKKGDSAYYSEDWEDKTWDEDQEADSSIHHKSKQETENDRRRRPGFTLGKGSKRKRRSRPRQQITSPPQPNINEGDMWTINNNPFSDQIRSARFPEKLNLTEFAKYELIQDQTETCESRLAESFFKQRAKDLNDFITRSKKYLEVEQMRQANSLRRDLDRSTPPRDRTRSEDRKRDRRGRGRDNKPPSIKPEFKGKYDRYTPLNVSRSQVWREVASTEMKKIDRPRPVRIQANTDQTRFCSFHDSQGHSTDQCYELRDAIEKFVREGKLRQYLIQTQGRKSEKRRQDDRHVSPAPERKRDEKRSKPRSEDAKEIPKGGPLCKGPT
ncbi:hypothetical protein K1719_038653 [Acacia pycnantha]|nr:hypothetical protein K1719_038653 [Acacia pycnantha]